MRILLSLFFITNIAFAQDTTLAYDVSQLSFQNKKIFDYLEIEWNLITTQSQIDPDTAYKKRVGLLEQYVEVLCLGQIEDRFWSAGGAQGSCQTYLASLEDLYPQSPIIPCAKEGTNSNNCLKAFASQYIDINGGSSQRNSAEIAIFRSKLFAKNEDSNLSQAKSDYESSRSEENFQKLSKALSEEIERDCQNAHLTFIPNEPPVHMKAGNIIKYGEKLKNELFRMVHELAIDPKNIPNLYAQGYFDIKFSPKTKSEEENHPFSINRKLPKPSYRPTSTFYRVRTLNSNCYESILEGFEFNPYFTASACSLYGFSSPECLRARKIEKDRKPIQKRLPPPPRPELSTF